MEIVYKLTDQNMRTWKRTQWTWGHWKETTGEGQLCGPGWLHCYSDPLLAVLFNPIDGDYRDPRLFQAQGEGKRKDDFGVKIGFTRLRLLKEIDVPKLSLEERQMFAILCDKQGIQTSVNNSSRRFAAAHAAFYAVQGARDHERARVLFAAYAACDAIRRHRVTNLASLAREAQAAVLDLAASAPAD